MISLPGRRRRLFDESPDPIRADIFGVERLEQHAESLAEAQRVYTGIRRGVRLLVRLEANARVLRDSYRSLTQAVQRDQAIAPAAEWLLDNFYIVEEQIREIREGLPPRYYRELPKLAEGHLENYPRVYGLVWAFVAHTDSRFDADLLERFIRAYQRVTPLTMGELWAIPITLRVVLIENLRRIAEGIVKAREGRAEASELADLLLEATDRSPGNVLLALEPYADSPLHGAFAVELVQRLRESDPAVMPALGWLEERLAAQETTPDEIVRHEHLNQLAAHATTVNVITSMRLISAFDWAEFFESVSLVERILRRDATRTYPQMDFATRDTYRHVIESLARGTGLPEEEVAERVVKRASGVAKAAGRIVADGDRAQYIGFHLIREGRQSFEKEVNYRAPLSRRLRRAVLGLSTPLYLGTIAVVSALLVALLLVYTAKLGLGWPVLALLGLLSLVPATDLAIAVLHQDVTEFFDPRRLPKLDLEAGIPDAFTTLVAVPTLLADETDTRDQIERLERNYLASAKGHLAFALLSDWKDADAESLPDDDRLLAIAAEGLAELNARYGPRPDGGPRFLLLHRRRVWNPGEGRWMGWERKRGKIQELNGLLRGDVETTFLQRGDGLTAIPAGVQFVITLDADTRVPPGTAHRLVGAMAHPLNRPRFDPEEGRVTMGYGILQPRITPMLPPAGEGTLYHQIFAGPAGIDPYASAVSDVYQDLFEEGSYVGKGIYDVDAFEAALNDLVPENRLLSHDLFEGSFARTGLVTDVELFDDFPTHYETSARRIHRWARGDWQLLPWILGSPPTRDGRRATNRLSVISRWKMIDNLRRTLSPIATFLLLVAGWMLVPASPLLWTAFVVATIAMPAAVPVMTGFMPRRRGIAKRSHIRGIVDDATQALARVGLAVVFVPNRAAIMADAIVRTLVRLYVTRRHLLEWVTAAAQAKRGVSRTLREVYAKMWPPVAAAASALILLLAIRPQAAPLALPFILLWLASPAFALWLSRPIRENPAEELGREGIQALRLVARQTWRYFEELVSEGEHWLPPDNLQEDPQPVIAHRTSPTNIGMYLLSTAAARDFAWIGTVEVGERLRRTFDTLGSLDRLHGHLYNWYDTRTLAPLEPRYVSTVDSGNLAGHLLTLAEACRELTRQPVLGGAALHGIADAVTLARDLARAVSDGFRSRTVSHHDLDDALSALAEGVSDPPEDPAGWSARLAELDASAAVLVDVAEVLAEDAGSEAAELAAWARAVRAGVASHARDLDMFAPWGRHLAAGAPEAVRDDPALAARWAALEAALSIVPSPEGVPAVGEAANTELTALRAALKGIAHPGRDAALRALDLIANGLEAARAKAVELSARLRALAAEADRWVEEMDFGVLYDPARDLFSIGYRPAEGKLDTGYYDLLGSEARLASLIAVAKGDVPVEHWFRLGRPVTPVGRGSALLSWSGSMFEYLMPYLVMEVAPGTLLERTQRLVVRRQIQYGAERGVPWGVSESGYNGRDLALTYQYSHFGIPGLGLTRGLSEDLVVAPYATALAAMIEPRAAVRNFERLAARGGRGSRGFYEALDFTPERVPKDQDVAWVKAYMAHHQGMTIVAIDNALNDGIMRGRFHKVPIIGAAELLLQERIPRDVAVARPRPEEVKAVRHVRAIVLPAVRRFTSPHTSVPRTHLLSNGRYTVMVTNAGSGYSRWKDLAVTRWREDPSRDAWGAFVYVRDVASGAVWSAGYQPSAAEPEFYEVTFSEDRAEIRRRDEAIWTSLEVIASPEDDGELRRVTIRNLGAKAREIELTTYAEVVLAPAETDLAHPAFQNLFVQTEFLPTFDALLATRRPRSADDPQAWAVHVVAVEGDTVGALQYETDRARFLDRGRGVRRPSSVGEGRPLSNTTGPVLDPILSLRRTVRLRSGETARVTFSTLVAESREAALAMADKYREPTTFEREAALAWTQAQVQLQHLGITPDEAHLFQRLASRILYLDPALRPASAVLAANARGQQALWGHGISGERPIVLVRIDQMRDREIVRQLIRAHEYWGWKGLAVDLVVMNEHPVSYAEDLQEWLDRSVRMSQSRTGHEAHRGHGDVHILRSDQVPKEDQDLLRTVARVILLSQRGSLTEQIEAVLRDERLVKPPPPVRAQPAAPDAPPPRPRLSFFNGLGGFAEGGREYVTILGADQWTPAPWINVIANPRFGFQVSESGSGFTWAMNSRENRLTPWSNDPVSDPPGEGLYLRDEDSGAVWTPTPLPIRENSPYQIRHGQGWSRFELLSQGIATDLIQYVPLDDSIKISRLTLKNHSGRTRRLSVTAYVEWVLGTFRERTAPFVVTEIDDETHALFARNRWSSEFADRVAFADLAGQQDEWTADRTEFLGRNGTLRHPAALAHGIALSGRVGAGLDPCAALRQKLVLPAGGSAEVVFFLGQGSDREEARRLVTRYRTADLDSVLDGVTQWWEDVLGALQVRTPDYSMAIMLNRWLLYQALACRVWARSAFYQSGGAYGFRDQLQDVMALVVARREIAREHLLRAAAHQFPEGDVQHWWHPPSGRGVRTRISDDRVWLPFALLHYLGVTGDGKILDERLPFLVGKPLAEGETEAYFEPAGSDETGTLFEHCARALDVSLGVGRHGLPLIGSGDWNDGMNRVGHKGEGESVWLAWFIDLTLQGFIPIAEARGEAARVERWRGWRAAIQPALAEHGWDGDWYRRAYFDDGTPLGSSSNEECRIDSIAQSWAVLARTERPDRAEHAMKAVEQYLVKRGDGLVLLFSPPFDHTPLDPGYIKGYLPGVRENGGQYTHAAIWSVIAFAELGEGDKAAELFSILNPINHASTRAGIHRYKVEPYVSVADVYAEPPHVGRGGWTWYTGSAGWMYRAGIEWILGFRLRGATLYLNPCIPRDWPGFEISFRYHSARYEVTVENPAGLMRGVRLVEMDSREVRDCGWNPNAEADVCRDPLAGARIPLVDDGEAHTIRVVLG